MKMQQTEAARHLRYPTIVNHSRAGACSSLCPRFSAEFPRTSPCLVSGEPSIVALAAHSRSLPHLGLRDHVATDAGRCSSGPLSPIPQAISDYPTSCCKYRSKCFGGVERAGILPSGTNASSSRAGGDVRIGRSVAEFISAAPQTTGHRSIYGKRNC